MDLVGFRVFKNFFLLQKLGILKALKLAMLIAYSDTQFGKFKSSNANFSAPKKLGLRSTKLKLFIVGGNWQ